MNADQMIDQNTYREIPLGRGFVAKVDPEDYRWLVLFKWNIRGTGSTCYASAYIPGLGTTQGMHRVIMQAKGKIDVDHKNGDGLDNRKENLRLATRAQNMLNRPVFGNSSKFKGVSYDRHTRKWLACVGIEGKRVILGRFDTELEAARAYNEAARKAHGEFAWLNPMPEDTEVIKQAIFSGVRRKPGRKHTVWFRRNSQAWYTTIEGKQTMLCRGPGNKELAEAKLKEIAPLIELARQERLAAKVRKRANGQTS